jgi:soluble epoxide hydrolase / lipid-phosphate phosphatase
MRCFQSSRVLLAVAFFIISIASDGLAVKFDPRGYTKKVVTCPAVNRAENRQVNIDLGTSFLGLLLQYMEEDSWLRVPVGYVDINSEGEKTLLLLHGWPSLWAGWKYQILEFQV